MSSFRLSGNRFRSLDLSEFPHITEHKDKSSKVMIENFIGFVPVPVGLAGPLQIKGPEMTGEGIFGTLATTEAALVASCSRGCNALNLCGGVQAEILREGMSRSPLFRFPSPLQAVNFARRLPELRTYFTAEAESTSRHLRLMNLTSHVIGSSVHVRFIYHCGDAAGQNMATIATQKACDSFSTSPLAKEFLVEEVLVEGKMSSDKKPSWGHVTEPRGVEVLAWGTLSNSVCQDVLGCSTETLYQFHMDIQNAGIRNGEFGCNVNAANVVTAMFIAAGQDPASVTEASWSQLTSEYDHKTKELQLCLYFPTMPVGVIGGGTSYDCQREALKMMNCAGPGTKKRLAGTIASFALALDISTSAAAATNTFAESHQRLARGGPQRRESKI
jgi:NADP-dependent 3-hydroxy-3-methylglutaryl-CoA reductase